MASKRQYGWVLQLNLSPGQQRALSQPAREGHLLAWELAKNGKERRSEALSGMPPEPLTLREAAEDEGISETTARRRLQQLRIELFGRDLSDSAIYYRLRKNRHPRDKCREPGCEQTLPPNAPTNRRYCNTHRTAAARTRRHRRHPGSESKRASA